jgi:hypothetical protein
MLAIQLDISNTHPSSDNFINQTAYIGHRPTSEANCRIHYLYTHNSPMDRRNACVPVWQTTPSILDFRLSPCSVLSMINFWVIPRCLVYIGRRFGTPLSGPSSKTWCMKCEWWEENLVFISNFCVIPRRLVYIGRRFGTTLSGPSSKAWCMKCEYIYKYHVLLPPRHCFTVKGIKTQQTENIKLQKIYSKTPDDGLMRSETCWVNN